MITIGKLALIPVGGVAALGIIELFSPSGPLPWPLPLFPSITIDEVETLTLNEPAHGEDYSAELDLTTDRFEDWNAPVEALSNTIEDWLGGGGALPDATSGDFETGLDPIEENSGTAFEFAEDVGGNVGGLFQWARALTIISNSGVGNFGLFVLACSVWLMLLRLFIFAVQTSDATWSVTTRLAQVFADFFIPW